MRRRRRWPWVVALLVLVGVVFALIRRGGAGPAPVDAALMVTVKRGALAIEILEAGRVEPREKVELKSKVAGQVAEVLVEEGAKVDKGQLLLVLDPTDYARDVARAEADVAQARNAINLAKWTLDRTKLGVEQNIVAANDLSAAGYELTARNIALRSAQVALGAAQDRLRYTKIHAPITGTVLQRGIEPGEVVTPGVQSTFDGKALLTVADLATLIVRVELNQIDVAKVLLAQAATLTLDALPGRTYEATITKIAPASVRPAGKDLEVFPVEAQLSKVDGLIKPGMTADVRIHLESKPDVLSLPIEAILKESGKSFVTRVLDGDDGKQKKEKIEVTLGSRNDREVEVLTGIEEGYRILIDPASAAANETKM